MSNAGTRGSRRLASFVAFLMATSFAGASDPPDAEANPVSGSIELADSFLDGADYEVRYAVTHDPGETPEAVILSDSGSSDLAPRIDIKSDGETWVVWWRDSATDEVVYRVKDYEAGTWSSEGRISGEGESGRHPSITHNGSRTWVTYETDTISGTGVAVASTVDGAEPFPTATIVATTTSTGSPDVLVRAESNSVWVSWVDSATEVGWSEYDASSGQWSAPSYESYASTTVKQARQNIRAIVLSN